jgi:hypothetical protein
MNLLKTLEELKNIKPDQTFSENSLRVILASTPIEPLSARRIFARSLATAGSLVMAGALVFIIAGGLSETKLAPQFSGIDPIALRAEAQAIDTQINLLNINYTENSISTQPTTPLTKVVKQLTTNNKSISSTTAVLASSTPSSTISVDDILQGLSQ